ncbi:hypothetical protein CR513_23419, partial [Mucuna pruriens]
MLDDSGYDSHFGYGKWKFTKGNLIVAKGDKISKLYWTKALVVKQSVNVMDMEASLWHQRLSHISEKGLNCLTKKDMLLGLKIAELEKCSHRMVGKQTRVSFKKHPPSKKLEFLELIHSDVCSPLKVKSFSGALYFVTFINDCSTKLWVYTLKSKNQVLEKFKHFQALVERQSGKKVKCICCNIGGEYCGPFDVYCKQQDIRDEKTPHKTPQLNGLTEKMNRALIERVGCMLFEASPAVALNTEVLHKIWFGKDVKYDHLRVSDCKAFVHVPKDERSKLDMKTRHCIFIRNGHDEYGYRMYDPVEKKFVKRRDVQFMEDQTIEDIDKVKKSTPEKDNSSPKIDPVRILVHDLDIADNNVQNGKQHNYLGDGFDVPLDDDAEEEQEMSQDENLGDALAPPPVQLRSSNRQRQLSTRYTSNEYMEKNLNVTRSPWRVKRGKKLDNLNYINVLLCPLPRQSLVLLRTNINYSVIVRVQFILVQAYRSEIRDALDAKLLELAKVHTDDNGVDMMTKAVLREKFEACCEIAKLAITST